MDILNKTKLNLLKLSLSSNFSYNMFDPIYGYFKNSADFVLRNSGCGIQVQTTESDVTRYYNGEEDDKNKFEEYISSDRSFIVKVTILDLRLAIKDRITFNGFSLEEFGFSSESIPVYKIVAAKGFKKNKI